MGDVLNKPLDRQYIYDAHDFNDLSGKRWAVFRKNIRKYPNRYGYNLIYRELEIDDHIDQVGELMFRWAHGRELQDNEVMVRFVMLGRLRWGLFNGHKLIGVNVGDENHTHGIYRYCIDNCMPFLNEYLRYRFYTSPWAQQKRWINDGGDLDNPSLARFKRKLNPVEIRTVYTYVPI
jgi:hypothetical protein